MNLFGSKKVLFPILIMIFCFSKLSGQNEDFFADSVWQENGEFDQGEDGNYTEDTQYYSSEFSDTDVAYKTIQLSYIEAEKVAGILRSMGYVVIDFETMEGTNENDPMIIPSEMSAGLLSKGSAQNSEDLPIVIPLPETTNITLLEMQAEAAGGNVEMGVELGGASLIYNTTGEPLQRIMIIYDPKDPAALSKLLNIITNELDVPAIQVIIEALVLEIDKEKVDQLGFNFLAEGNMVSTGFPGLSSETGTFSPYTLIMDKSLLGAALDVEAQLQALLSSKEADILSRPSVLVLDGRQARIVVGQQIPVSTSTATGQNVVSSTDYLPVGIVLNLRPRVSGDRRTVTLQVETIISEATERIGIGSIGTSVLSAPVFNSRKVQTYVQVSNRTPFIIGGLISKKKSIQEGKVPLIGKIPLLGRFFTYSKEVENNREVIVVITPNIVEVQQNNFSRVIPKDHELFQLLGNMLFQNSYRVKNSDVYDLGFVFNDKSYIDTHNRIKSIMDSMPEKGNALLFELNEEIDLSQIKRLYEGYMPGEEVMIKRMLYDIIERNNYYKHVKPQNILYWTADEDDPGSTNMNNFAENYIPFYKEDAKNNKGFSLRFHLPELESEEHLTRPIVEQSIINLGIDANYKGLLRELNVNSEEPHILLYQNSHERRLREVLILNRLIEMNGDILEDLLNFKPGIEIILPAPETLEGEYFVIDLNTARTFYEINDFNNVFDKRFLSEIKRINTLLDIWEQ
ncbi:MAG: hypothetical protein CMG75_04895 [Candidatus Marinimicrobia bacterium]|nr:hypothetical protein [Candidatus Neomarinimicrobiota bacterium]|tara:strand:- start:3026 stop:5245 length:2220 start_codon:yes stop_codon:yes gene_type:complete